MNILARRVAYRFLVAQSFVDIDKMKGNPRQVVGDALQEIAEKIFGHPKAGQSGYIYVADSGGLLEKWWDKAFGIRKQRTLELTIKELVEFWTEDTSNIDEAALAEMQSGSGETKWQEEQARLHELDRKWRGNVRVTVKPVRGQRAGWKISWN